MTNTTTTDSDPEHEKCSICLETINKRGMPYYSALKHYIEEHPKSQILRDVLDPVSVWVECRDCGDEFAEPVNYTVSDEGPHLSVDIYCDECAEKDPYRKILATDIDARYVIDNQVTGTSGDCYDPIRVEQDGGMVGTSYPGTHLTCPECEQATPINLPRGNCKHCDAELAVEVVAHPGGGSDE